NGNDSYDGSYSYPKLTIQAGIDQIESYGDASSLKQYGIIVLPGTYSDTINLYPWILISGFNDTIISGNITIGTQSAYNGISDLRNGLINLTFASSIISCTFAVNNPLS
ncbi:MAG TPA: hypothetical protein PKI46_09000, partial [Bacteroidales bacterium]|nr:hypothetical protein [Bacteroidales bacterium]